MDIKEWITGFGLGGDESWRGVGVFGGGIGDVGMFEVCIGDTGLEVGVVAGDGVEGGFVVGRGGVQAGSVVIPGSGLVRILGEIGDGSDSLIGSSCRVLRGGVFLWLFLVHGEYPWGV